jgi:hypothetical protein
LRASEKQYRCSAQLQEDIIGQRIEGSASR